MANTVEYNLVPRPGDISHKEYFLRFDNLENMTKEIIFSMFRRYNCLAGCKVCYTDKLFAKNDPSFGRHIPEVIDLRYTENLLNKVFPFFYSHSTIDDLYWCYHKHRHIYDWYLQNQRHFSMGNMTDNGFVRIAPLLLRDFTDIKIYEITFSDEWLDRIKNHHNIIDLLTQLQAKFPITKIKIVQSTHDYTHEVITWARDNGVGISRHFDVIAGDTIDLASEQTLNYCSQNGFLYPICCESDYLQYDSFFLTLEEAIDPRSEPYDTEWDPFKHLSKSLHAKKRLYSRYAEKLADTENEINKKYCEYFKWVSEHLEVNDDYTFIPNVALSKWNNYYNELSKFWVETDYGLIKPNEEPKPLYTFSD